MGNESTEGNEINRGINNSISEDEIKKKPINLIKRIFSNRGTESFQ